jgi:hypothetical protein
VTRRDTTGFPPNGWIPRQRLTVQEAIDAYTKGSAFAEGLETLKGTVEKGKYADLVVLTQNPLRISPRRLLRTRVWMTVCNGRIVYESAPPP